MNLHLEQDDDSRTLAFVSERNAASHALLATPEYEADRVAIKTMMEREDRLIKPTRRGDWLFDFRRSADNPLGSWRRLPADLAPVPTAPWEVIFDLDAFCKTEGKRWLWGGAVSCPWEPTRVLLCLSDGGSDLTRLLEFDCRAGEIVADGFDTPAARAHATWLSRDEIVYFGAIDRFSATQSGWPRVGRRLKRGETPADAAIVFEAADSDVYASCVVIDPVHGSPTPSGELLTLFIVGHEIGSASIEIEDIGGTRRRLDIPREAEVQFNTDHCLWLAKTGEQVPAGSLILQPLARRPEDADQARQHRRALFSPTERQSLSQFILLSEWCVFVVSDNLRPRLFALDLKLEKGAIREIALPEGVEAISLRSLHVDLHQGDDTLLVYGEGFLSPPTCHRLDLVDRSSKLELAAIAQAPAYFDASGMDAHLLTAISEDGTKIPYRLVLPKAWTRSELPVLIYGYGGFDVSLQPFYSGVIGRWLEQGGAYVQAYIRGGGELGPDWHRSAKRHGRHRAFADFAAIARDLVARGYSTAARIACNGGSNGGLLTGVMLTRYAADFGAVWCQVPVLDMMRFHAFAAGRAWMDEYGNPDDPTDRDYLMGYSPLHNVKPAAEISYPPIYIESSSNDDRVHPSHARRMAARLEEAGHHPLFHEFGSGGHGGGGDTTELAARVAMGYSFLRLAIVRQSL